MSDSKDADTRSTIGVIMLGQFYVKDVPVDTCERVNLKMKTDVKAGRGLAFRSWQISQVDKKGGSTMSFKKYGMEKAWRMARALARWD